MKSKECIYRRGKTSLKRRGNTPDIIEGVIEQFEKFIWGYHVLEDLINDSTISDIKVMDETIYVLKGMEKNGCNRYSF